MEFLEDILKQYGIATDYWPPDESVGAPERQVDRDALWRDAVLAGADPGAELLAAVNHDRAGRTTLPLAMTLGDIRAEKGQVEAALGVYEFAVLAEDDPARLCELGYLLLQRCRVDELPLCDKDFDGEDVDFPGGETVFISSHRVDLDNPGPEFGRKPALLDVAICAFGRAYVRCVQRFLRDMGWPGAEKWQDATELLERMAAAEDKWHELVALDGLRAAFMEADDLDGLESVILEYYGWMEDYEKGVPGLNVLAHMIAKERGLTPSLVGEAEPDRESPFYAFEVKFFKAEPWLRARRKAPPSGEPGLTKGDRLLLWQLRELSQQLRHQRGRTEQWDSLLQTITQKLERTPQGIVEAFKKDLAKKYGDMWARLPLEVQGFVIQAEFLHSTFRTVVDADWAAVVLQYARALEGLLRMRLGPRLDKALEPKYSYTRARLESFRKLFDSPQFAGLRGLPGAERMRALGCPLDGVIRNYRTPSAHPGPRMASSKADDLRTLLLETEDQRLGLLWEISSL